MKLSNVEEYQNLKKDMTTGGVVNINKKGLDEAKKAKSRILQQNAMIDELKDRLDLFEVKLKQLLTMYDKEDI